MQSPILIFLLWCSAAYGVNASKNLEEAILKKDFPAIVHWLEREQDKQKRAGAIDSVVYMFQDPRTLHAKHRKKLKKFEEEIVRYQADFNELPPLLNDTSVVVRWNMYLPRVLLKK